MVLRGWFFNRVFIKHNYFNSLFDFLMRAICLLMKTTGFSSVSCDWVINDDYFLFFLLLCFFFALFNLQAHLILSFGYLVSDWIIKTSDSTLFVFFENFLGLHRTWFCWFTAKTMFAKSTLFMTTNSWLGCSRGSSVFSEGYWSGSSVSKPNEPTLNT